MGLSISSPGGDFNCDGIQTQGVGGNGDRGLKKEV